MHVVFYNRSYHPDTGATGQLLTELTQDLVRDYGCEVTVVTEGHGGRGLVGSEVHQGVRILRARGTRFSKRGFLGRFTNYLSYFGSSIWASRGIESPDVVVALTDPPIIGLAAWAVSKRSGAPFVFLCQDVFPEVASLLTDFQSGIVNGLLQRVNCFLVQRASRIIALGECMKLRLVEGKGASPAKITVISNWADGSVFAPGPKDNAFSREHGLAEKFVVMHSGNIGLSQELDMLIEAAARLAHEPDVVFVLVGDGVRRAPLENEVRARSLENVRFLPYQPRERLRDSYATADVFLVSLKQGLAGYIVPSKLYSILAAGRPFVAAIEPVSETARIARQYDCGSLVAPGDVGGLVHEITRFHRDRKLAERLGRNAREASAHFERGRQVRAYYDLLSGELRSADASAHATLEARL